MISMPRTNHALDRAPWRYPEQQDSPGAGLLDVPIRRVTVSCEAARPFAFPSAGTLEPYYVLRGLIGGAITARSRELGQALFKPEPLRDLGGDDHSEEPGAPWRLRLSHLYGRDIIRRFDLVVDLIGEEPCHLVAELVAAVRLAGSGAPYRDWRTGRLRHWGIEIPSGGNTPPARVGFEVVAADTPAAMRLGDVVDKSASHWKRARGAMLVFRTLTILTSRMEGMRKGVPLAFTGEVDALSLIRNALRRLAVLDFATRRNPAERRWCDLRAALAQKERAMSAAAAEFPLQCRDAVTVPLELAIRGNRSLRGLVGSANFTAPRLEPWQLGFAACEILGVGESTSYGAGQVAWLPVSEP